jgi:two-component system, sensor histidine kinase YesM
MKTLLLLVFISVYSITDLFAQNSVRQDTLAIDAGTSSVKVASNRLLQSIADKKSNSEIAANYAELAKALANTGDYAKALSYINKAIQLESDTKTKANLGAYYRELGRIQEALKSYPQASASYRKASELSGDSLSKRLNRNDAQRMQVKSSPEAELELLNSNAYILSNSNNNREKIRNFTQIANTNISLNNNAVALENYRDALNSVDSTSEEAVEIKSNMVDIMASNKDVENAIVLQKEILVSAFNIDNVAIQLEQLRNFSVLLLQIDSTEAAINILDNAYRLALSKGNIKEARQCLLALTSVYEKNKQNDKAQLLYSNFVKQLDTLLAKDSSIIDKKLFLINEDKIFELEQQQLLKDELILRKNRSNYALIGSLLLLLLLLGIIVKALFSIRKRNKLIALQSLRREMNPHFIFNSLNSVNQFIAVNNEREANKYLTSYSNLMRNIMENSNKDYIALSTELDLLRKYLELEKLRFSDKFDYRIEIDPEINADEVQVPNMLIQPNLENAIWHGLRYKETPGLLLLKFKKNGTKTIAIIDDNGIGLAESKRIKTSNQKRYESLGLKNVEERINLLNSIYKTTINFQITEKTGSETGTEVRIEW